MHHWGVRIELVGAIHKITVSNPLNFKWVLTLFFIIRDHAVLQKSRLQAVAGRGKAIDQTSPKRNGGRRGYRRWGSISFLYRRYTSPAGNPLSQVKMGSFTQTGFVMNERRYNPCSGSKNQAYLLRNHPIPIRFSGGLDAFPWWPVLIKGELFFAHLSPVARSREKNNP